MVNFEFSTTNPEELPTVYVDMDQWKESGPNSQLKTDGVGPCVVVAVHIPGRGALLGHFSDPMEIVDNPKTSGLFTDFIEHLQDTRALNNDSMVWIGGAAHSSTEDDDFNLQVTKNLDYVIQELHGLGTTDSQITYAISGVDESVEVSIDANSGKMKVISSKFTN